MTSIGGNLKLQGNSLQDQHIKISLSEPSPLNLGRKYGSRGHPGNVKLLCGWPFGTVVGLRTVYKKEASLILSIARFEGPSVASAATGL